MVSDVYINIDMYKCMVKIYNVLNSIWQTYATVDFVSLCFQLTCIALVWVRDKKVHFCADINYLLSVHSTSTIT